MHSLKSGIQNAHVQWCPIYCWFENNNEFCIVAILKYYDSNEYHCASNLCLVYLTPIWSSYIENCAFVLMLLHYKCKYSIFW